jgi:hypothetical protein
MGILLGAIASEMIEARKSKAVGMGILESRLEWR